jgi:hypothetical protein
MYVYLCTYTLCMPMCILGVHMKLYFLTLCVNINISLFYFRFAGSKFLKGDCVMKTKALVAIHNSKALSLTIAIKKSIYLLGHPHNLRLKWTALYKHYPWE